MPELPEVEAVVRTLRDNGLVGSRLKALTVHRALVLRPQSAAEVEDRTVNRSVTQVRRRAKNILIDLSGGETIQVHLRMTGDLIVEADPRRYVGPEAASVRLEWQLSSQRRLLFLDPRALCRVRVLTSYQLMRRKRSSAVRRLLLLPLPNI